MLSDESVLVRVTVATLITFGPLYVLQSMGYKWAWYVAILAFLGLLFTNFGKSFTVRG